MESDSNSRIFCFLAPKAACCVVLFLALTGSFSGLGLLASGGSLLYLGPVGLILAVGITYGLFRRRQRKTGKTSMTGVTDHRPDDSAESTIRST